ncbi:Kynureninase [Rhodanobacter lindaniclasticus]
MVLDPVPLNALSSERVVTDSKVPFGELYLRPGTYRVVYCDENNATLFSQNVTIKGHSPRPPRSQPRAATAGPWPRWFAATWRNPPSIRGTDSMTHHRMRVLLATACALATFAAVGAEPAAPSQAGLLGFTSAHATTQLDLERRFDAQLDPAELRDWLKRMASAPNQVGSPHDKANAEFMLEKFRAWGWDAHIETFEVLYPTPKKVALELLGPQPFTATLHEPPVAGDATSALPGALPPYNVYGGDGDVTASLVYANYGMPDDYKELARRGIDVRGKIVITRYGGGWRGLKPKLAQEHGAIGCLIYSDPHEDGYAQGDTWPDGGWRPAEGVQRGSVADMQQYPGDPLTPGIGSTPGAKRLAIKDAKTLLKIPVLPISWADATPLLQSLGGPVAPAAWRGALPLTYHVGPSKAEAHLTVLSDWSRKPIYDVIAKIKGASAPDQWIIRGNHHDGWVFGAWDPLAGNVALMAEAKAIGGLLKQGWRPRRTLVYASWDGEEPGLLGSTEWAEAHAKELQAKAVLYVNSDTNGRGFLGVGGSHSLQHLVNQVADGVADPETRVSVGTRWRRAPDARRQPCRRESRGQGQRQAGGRRQGSADRGAGLRLGLQPVPGTPRHRLARPGFRRRGDNSGTYHSRYDSFDHYVRFGDPTFEYGVALAKVAGHIVLRTADADVLPLRFGDFSQTLHRYVDQPLAARLRAERAAPRRLRTTRFRHGTPGRRRAARSVQWSVLRHLSGRTNAAARWRCPFRRRHRVRRRRDRACAARADSRIAPAVPPRAQDARRRGRPGRDRHAGAPARQRGRYDHGHAVGNLPLEWHDADFAIWCSCKTRTAAPAPSAARSCTQRHATAALPRFAGWWGHDKTTRFQMGSEFHPTPGADGWQLSNPPILALAPLRCRWKSSAAPAWIACARNRSNLTGYLEYLVQTQLADVLQVVTPAEPERRGAQLSMPRDRRPRTRPRLVRIPDGPRHHRRLARTPTSSASRRRRCTTGSRIALRLRRRCGGGVPATQPNTLIVCPPSR